MSCARVVMRWRRRIRGIDRIDVRARPMPTCRARRVNGVVGWAADLSGTLLGSTTEAIKSGAEKTKV